MTRTIAVGFAAGFLSLCTPGPTPRVASSPAGAVALAATPLIDWSNEARRAIVPPGAGGIFGTENYGNKFPGEAAVYMGIVHAAIYDAAVAIAGVR